MNLQSWILLAVILAVCTYIVYTKFVKKSDSCGCGECSACSSKDKKSCCD
ncbi:FeoB-associated Cys-rich membrane protein [Anaerococcus murdochii]|uniref:FeoB-associated Cys-rich membrane protein n=1 Tax=Anaerococcus murdochii TaxID=411577 RepID=A0ABS7SZ17_9FIRM|nr:FeoB-associated Cys-rich membrane protein [Anaerococcus murdochii]MBZ2386775.1 FeoB-associated Cys-rich membrane protein [Anaerococcus murdochii]